MTRVPHTEVLIAGDGLAALTMALSLKTACPELTVGLLSPKGPPALPSTWDLRVYAIAQPLERLLNTTGAWPLMRHRVSQMIERMVIWDHRDQPQSPNALTFGAEHTGQSHLGMMLEQADVQQALWQRLQQLGVDVVNAPVTDVRFTPEWVYVEGAPVALKAKLLIAADGQHSALRQQAGLQWREKRYDQTAIVGHFTTVEGHRNTAWQRFLPTGPLALLPLAQGKVSCVYSLPHALAERWMSASASEFAQEITRQSAAVLGDLTSDSERASFALRFGGLTRYARARMAFVGDAAHLVHPLAGQGINQGIQDVLALTETVADAHRRGQDVGDSIPLMAYSRRRCAQNAVMGTSIDGIFELFQSTSALASMARRGGFHALNRMPILKSQLARRAMGVS